MPQPAELTWAPYVLDGRAHAHYFESDRYYASFPPGAVVVDVGCGDGAQVQRLIDRGCRAVGTEVDAGCIARARALGRPVVEAPAEALPFDTGSVDGVVFRGVLPFTDESKAFAEIARVLRPGGRMEAEYLGLGFGLRYMLAGVRLGERVYGARSLVTSGLRAVARRKLPGALGDTGYVTHGRLARHYARHGFRLASSSPSPTYFGLPVFIYHSVERVAG